MTRTIRTCPGLGDSVWLMMKLINQPEKFNWKIGNGLPQRGHQLFELLPQLTESFEYISDCGYNKVKRNSYKGGWAKAPNDFYLEANSHLEQGKRIEMFLPDLKTSFVLDYVTGGSAVIKAEEILYGPFYEQDQPPLIGIYTSSYNNSQHMSGWSDKEWLELIRLIRKYSPAYRFVFLGAPYDIGITDKLIAEMKPGQYVNTIGQPLPVVVEILKRLDCFIGFQSGLSIINETISAKQTVMLYSPALERMMTAWPDPQRIESGAYKGCVFCPPSAIFNWLILNKKI